MPKKIIDIGLGVNITQLGGLFVVSSVDTAQNSVSLYSIAENAEKPAVLSDIDMAINSDVSSMQALSLQVIVKNIDEALSAEQTTLEELRQKVRDSEAHIANLTTAKKHCQEYYGEE